MTTQSQKVSHPTLKGAEQHLPLKNQPGEKGDKDHAETNETLSDEAAKTVDASDAETQIADALRDLSDKG
ncbi:hypothetical protein [Roseobacter weihaiensis]|uniref:hypothetical protein n=1 Tax=Roseobacter weihaiensis TaxID=2763262 RepID=UPI001D09C875|nr:hypothetical protein [Roseobacter sp. H9]